MAEKPVPMLTPEAYLEIERQAEFKSEYYKGEMFAMSGATRFHVRLSSNLVHEIRKVLDGERCFVFSNDLRIHIPSNGLYTYPDVGVVCDEDIYQDEHFDTLLNPVLLIEILSKSTESYDRGRKFEFYREIESLQEYVLVAQDRKSIEVFYRNEQGSWSLREPKDDSIVMIGHTFALDEIYKGVELEPSPRLRESDDS